MGLSSVTSIVQYYMKIITLWTINSSMEASLISGTGVSAGSGFWRQQSALLGERCQRLENSDDYFASAEFEPSIRTSRRCNCQ
jgi:hypothetical protein